MHVVWRSKPVFVRHLTAKEVADSKSADWQKMIDPASEETRVQEGHDQWLVVIGICTHLGCIPLDKEGPFDGWFCPCHGSIYDTFGRIRQGPAPLNLAIPPYAFRQRHQDPDRRRTDAHGVKRRGWIKVRTNERIHRPTFPRARLPNGSKARLPIVGLVHSSFIAYPTPRNLNYLWTFGGILAFCSVAQIVTGIVLAMHYTPECDAGLQLRRAHHARRELRLADPLSARQRRLDVLPRRLHPHLPRHLLRLLQGAARGAVAARRHHLPPDDGHRLHGLRAALGPDELLGRDGDHQPLLGASRWSATPSSPGCGAASRSTIRRSTASSRCTTCCRS